jgi:hypothetical protein
VVIYQTGSRTCPHPPLHRLPYRLSLRQRQHRRQGDDSLNIDQQKSCKHVQKETNHPIPTCSACSSGEQGLVSYQPPHQRSWIISQRTLILENITTLSPQIEALSGHMIKLTSICCLNTSKHARALDLVA